MKSFRIYSRSKRDSTYRNSAAAIECPECGDRNGKLSDQGTRFCDYLIFTGRARTLICQNCGCRIQTVELRVQDVFAIHRVAK